MANFSMPIFANLFSEISMAIGLYFLFFSRAWLLNEMPHPPRRELYFIKLCLMPPNVLHGKFKIIFIASLSIPIAFIGIGSSHGPVLYRH